MSATVAQRAAVRTERFKRAIASSLLSKVGSVLVQFFAMPMAIAAMGERRWGAYSTTVASVLWFTFVSIGAGPSLTRHLAAAFGTDDRERESVLFSNGFVTCLIDAVVGGAILAAFCFSPGLEGVLGNAVRGEVAGARAALGVLAAILPITILCGIADSMYNGYQEQSVTNVWSFVMSLLTLPLLWLVRLSPSLPMMAFALFAPTAVTKLAGLGQLMFVRHPHLRLRAGFVKAKVVKSLLFSSGLFTLLSVGSYLNGQVSVYVAGRRSAADAAQLGTLMLLYGLIISVASMVNNTLWPALVEARERGDRAWVARAVRGALFANLFLGTASLFALGLGAPWVAASWYKVPLSNPASTSWAMGALMFAMILENMQIMMAVGLGRLKTAAFVFVGRSAAIAFLYPFVGERYGVAGILWLSPISVLAGPIWIMAAANRAALREGGRREPDEPLLPDPAAEVVP